MTVREIFRNPFGAVIPGIENLGRMKIINETQAATTTTPSAHDEESTEAASEEAEEEPQEQSPKAENSTLQNPIPQQQFKPIPIPIVYPEWVSRTCFYLFFFNLTSIFFLVEISTIANIFNQ